MATTTLTVNPELVTVPANTNEHELDFSTLFGSGIEAEVDFIRASGTSVQISTLGAVGATSAALNTTTPTFTCRVFRGVNVRFKGGAGSETFVVVFRKLR